MLPSLRPRSVRFVQIHGFHVFSCGRRHSLQEIQTTSDTIEVNMVVFAFKFVLNHFILCAILILRALLNRLLLDKVRRVLSTQHHRLLGSCIDTLIAAVVIKAFWLCPRLSTRSSRKMMVPRVSVYCRLVMKHRFSGLI